MSDGPSPRRALGAMGEDLAAAWLSAAGYRILARNVRAGGVELDLVARRGRVLAIVEVKTRRSRHLGPPELAVDAHKRARLVRGARAWIYEHPQPGARVRFDVIAVEPDAAGELRIRHLCAAFDLGDL
ncbi:MAG: YraN family protein [Myxococcota bacterium]|nr:YraN family protein [Myxococcota bacterium]